MTIQIAWVCFSLCGHLSAADPAATPFLVEIMKQVPELWYFSKDGDHIPKDHHLFQWVAAKEAELQQMGVTLTYDPRAIIPGFCAASGPSADSKTVVIGINRKEIAAQRPFVAHRFELAWLGLMHEMFNAGKGRQHNVLYNKVTNDVISKEQFVKEMIALELNAQFASLKFHEQGMEVLRREYPGREFNHIKTRTKWVSQNTPAHVLSLYQNKSLGAYYEWRYDSLVTQRPRPR